MSVVLARVDGVRKQFAGVHAVRGVSCEFRSREIHAVCGENGAGKSTLLKLVAGMLEPDGGEVLVGGRRLDPHTPREASQRGVAMVLQHFALVPVFTALENIMLGAEPTTGLGGQMLDRAAARTRAIKIGEELGTTLPLDTVVEELGIGDRQRIEIARALFRDAQLVILDEPTAVLTKSEAKALYATIRRLADAGKGIVVVTHKMDEVRAHADVVTVMRKGELVFSRPLDHDKDIDAQVAEVTAAIMSGAGATHDALEVHRVSDKDIGDEDVLVMDAVRAEGLGPIDLRIKAGEVVGMAGVEGNGQKELVSVLAGETTPTEGAMRGGPFAIVHEDRQKEGLVLDASLRDNIVLGELHRFTVWGLFVDTKKMNREASARIERSGAPTDLDRAARTLSGGNQQKIVVTRALARSAKVIVAAQPTRGVDLAASNDIHVELLAAAKGGAGVLVISADLDELRKLSSRIVVLARGRIAGELPPTASDEELGRLMLGVTA